MAGEAAPQCLQSILRRQRKKDRNGSELDSVQTPVEFEFGIVNCTLATESIESVISLKDPIVGAGALIVKVIVFEAVVHFCVIAWLARI